jgi:acetyl esterase/lipase
MPAAEFAAPLRRAARTLGVRLEAAVSWFLFLLANLPSWFGSYRRVSNLTYGALPEQQLDVYLPANGTAGRAPRALILFWHGGRWSFGDKNQYRFVGAALAALGCVAVVPNYRHYPQVKMSGFLSDAALATRWALEHAAEHGADARRVHLMGHSAGAHMAAMLALDRRYLTAAGVTEDVRFAGVIGLSGPYDFLPLREADVQDMFGPEDNYPESQPINYVSAAAPPMLLVHGLRDETVRPKNSRNLAAALHNLGVSVTLTLYERIAHAGTVAALSPLALASRQVRADIAAFCDRRFSPGDR